MLLERGFHSCSGFSGVGSTSDSVTGIDIMCPSSKEDFNEFEKLLKEKISQFEKSVHYSSFLESLFRELCLSCKCSIFLCHLEVCNLYQQLLSLCYSRSR